MAQNDETGALRTLLLHFPDDLTSLEFGDLNGNRNFDPEYDDIALIRSMLPIAHKLAETLETGERWEIDINREKLSEIALSLSLCPMHLIDYAICFDDENAECAQLRTYFPLHDT